MTAQVSLSKIWYPPNLISLARLLLTIPIVLLIASPGHAHDTLLYLLVSLAILSDYFDGYLSRRLGQITDLGKVLDPLADKVIMACSLYALVRYRGFPAYILLLLLYRDVLILAFGAVLSLRSKRVYAALFWGKVNTAVVSVGCLSFLVLPGRSFTTWLLILGTATIFISGISYYRFGEPLLFRNHFARWCIRLVIAVLPLCVVAWCDIPVKTPRHLIRNYEVTYAPAEAGEWLRRHSPVLYLAEEELYEPLPVESFLDNAVLMRKSRFAPLLLDDPVPLPLPGALPAGQGDRFYLKAKRPFFQNPASLYGRIERQYSRVVYASAMRIEGERGVAYILQYWLFFWASNLGSTGVPWHECDWEMIMYELDAQGRPVRAGYSQHYYGEVRDWAGVEQEDGRPVVYLSYGGHSAHFEAGVYPAYLDSGKNLPLGSDRCQKGRRLGPENYALTEIERASPWFRFAGAWGLPVTTRLEGPRYRNPRNRELTMWENPVGWLDRYSGDQVRLQPASHRAE